MLVGPAPAVHIAARARNPLGLQTVPPVFSLAKDSLMTIRSFGALLAFLLTTAAIAPAMAQETQPAPDATTGQTAQPAGPPPETVVAVVNGKKVTRADVIASAKSLPAE